MPYVELQTVSKIYRSDGAADVAALRDVTLAFEAGQFVALVGRSGCGKSTLLNLCGAMDFPTSGRVLLGGVSTSDLGESGLTKLRRAQVGFVFQAFQLLPTLTVAENVELPLLLASSSPDTARKRALEALDWVELPSVQNYGARLPHQLSGGQMQRVAIARALVHGPKLILADEPIGNLDSTTGEVVLGLLGRAASERGATVLMATHSQESAARCDRTVQLKDGSVFERSSGGSDGGH
jgi:ABC-type lipoprotein export system ATPase subunit